MNTVSTDTGNLLSTGQDSLPYLSVNTLIAAVENARWGTTDRNAPAAHDAPDQDSEPDDYADHDPATGDAPDYHAGYESEVKVGDVIDPIPEAGHEGPQVVTAVTEHPDGTALELRPATPEEIAAHPAPSPEPAPAQAA